MNATHKIAVPAAAGGRNADSKSRIRWRRALLATTTALSLGAQNAAWATCSDGTTMPNDGFVVGRDKQVLTAANWSPNVFTAPAGSLFVPDSSVYERNDPAQPLTGGGHNWVFDQGSTLCKVTDTGPARRRGNGLEHPAELPDRLHPSADHQGRHGHQPRRHSVPGPGDHPGLQSPPVERKRRAQQAEHLRQPARLLDLPRRCHHPADRDVLHVRGRHQGRAVLGPAQQRRHRGEGRRGRQDGRAAELLLEHPGGPEAHQRRGQPGRAVRHGHLDPAGAVRLCMPQPAGRSGRHQEADQPELLRPAGEFRAMHAGRQQRPGD